MRNTSESSFKLTNSVRRMFVVRDGRDGKVLASL